MNLVNAIWTPLAAMRGNSRLDTDQLLPYMDSIPKIDHPPGIHEREFRWEDDCSGGFEAGYRVDARLIHPIQLGLGSGLGCRCTPDTPHSVRVRVRVRVSIHA